MRVRHAPAPCACASAMRQRHAPAPCAQKIEGPNRVAIQAFEGSGSHRLHAHGTCDAAAGAAALTGFASALAFAIGGVEDVVFFTALRGRANA